MDLRAFATRKKALFRTVYGPAGKLLGKSLPAGIAEDALCVRSAGQSHKSSFRPLPLLLLAWTVLWFLALPRARQVYPNLTFDNHALLGNVLVVSWLLGIAVGLWFFVYVMPMLLFRKLGVDLRSSILVLTSGRIWVWTPKEFLPIDASEVKLLAYLAARPPGSIWNMNKPLRAVQSERNLCVLVVHTESEIYNVGIKCSYEGLRLLAPYLNRDVQFEWYDFTLQEQRVLAHLVSQAWARPAADAWSISSPSEIAAFVEAYSAIEPPLDVTARNGDLDADMDADMDADAAITSRRRRRVIEFIVGVVLILIARSLHS